WRKEVPGSVLKRRDLALAAFPCSGGWGCDDVPVTLGRFGGRRSQIAVEHAKLHDRVEKLQAFIVGDVLLRLGRQDEGQFEICGLFHDGVPLAFGSAKRIRLTVDAGINARECASLYGSLPHLWRLQIRSGCALGDREQRACPLDCGRDRPNLFAEWPSGRERYQSRGGSMKDSCCAPGRQSQPAEAKVQSGPEKQQQRACGSKGKPPSEDIVWLEGGRSYCGTTRVVIKGDGEERRPARVRPFGIERFA